MMSGRKDTSPSQDMREQETESRVASTYSVQGAWGRGHLTFLGLNSKWLF